MKLFVDCEDAGRTFEADGRWKAILHLWNEITNYPQLKGAKKSLFAEVPPKLRTKKAKPVSFAPVEIFYEGPPVVIPGEEDIVLD